MTHDSVLRRRPAAIAALALALATSAVLSGCSSSGSSSGTSGDSPSNHPATASTSASGSAGSPASTTATSGTSKISIGGGFCTQAALAQAKQAKQATALAGGTPAELQKLEQQDLAELPAFLAIAPSAIKGDLTVVVAADRKLYSALAAVHFDVRKIDPTTFAQVDTPQFTKATAAIASYLSTQCGIHTTTG